MKKKQPTEQERIESNRRQDLEELKYARFPAGTKEGDFMRRIEAVSAAAIGFAKAIEKLEIWGEPVSLHKLPPP